MLAKASADVALGRSKIIPDRCYGRLVRLRLLSRFERGFVREREQQNVSRIDPVLEQVRHAIREGARFSRARAGYHKDRAGGSGHRRELLFVQLSDVVDVNRRGNWGALQRVLRGHLIIADFGLLARRSLGGGGSIADWKEPQQ
jgi:hypothetical protein